MYVHAADNPSMKDHGYFEAVNDLEKKLKPIIAALEQENKQLREIVAAVRKITGKEPHYIEYKHMKELKQKLAALDAGKEARA